VPLAVMPTSFGLPLLGPLLITGGPSPNQLRSQLQQTPQLQYPVTSIVITTGVRPAGGRIRAVKQPAHQTKSGRQRPAMTADR
jgi:hypothetical protein